MSVFPWRLTYLPWSLERRWHDGTGLFRDAIGSTFGRNVLVLGGGTFIAQGIAMALAPILARLYPPEDFGLYATYMTVVSILALVATCNLESVIILPRRDRQGAALLMLLLGVCALTSLGLGIGLIVLAPLITAWFGNSDLALLLHLLPLSVFLLGSYQGLRAWTIRRAAYRDLARNTVVRSGCGAGLACGFGLSAPVAATPGLGLVGAQILAEGLGNLTLAWAIRCRDGGLFPPPRRRYILPPARRYGRLAIACFTSQAISAIYDKLPILAVGWLYGVGAAGLFAWAERFAILPALLVARAIGDVFRQRAAHEFRSKGRFDDLTRRTLLVTLSLAIIPYGLGIAFAPWLFEILFGTTWRPAGEFAAVLMLGGFVGFVVTPVDAAIVIRERGLFSIGRHLARLLGEGGAALAAFAFDLPIVTLLWLLVVVRISIYLVDGLFAWHLAKGAPLVVRGEG